MRLWISIMLFALMNTLAYGAGEGENREKERNGKSSYAISGTVTDMETGETLAGVKLTLRGKDQSAYTDFNGEFIFRDLVPDTYQIQTHYVSYGTKNIRNIELFKEAPMNLDIKIKRKV